MAASLPDDLRQGFERAEPVRRLGVRHPFPARGEGVEIRGLLGDWGGRSRVEPDEPACLSARAWTATSRVLSPDQNLSKSRYLPCGCRIERPVQAVEEAGEVSGSASAGDVAVRADEDRLVEVIPGVDPDGG
jgi:hypothetical protein